MLTKIFFTLLVILVVALLFRTKNESKVLKTEPPKHTAKEKDGVQPRTVIYALLGLIIAISALLFVLSWQDSHQIINIRVTDSRGNQVDYQAYKQSIEGRRFTTLDGRDVELGDSDRVEMTGTE